MGYRVIAIDAAGHGGTFGLPGGGGDLSDYAALIGRVLDHLGIRRAVLAGHSMGGRLIVELAAETPDRVIALLLLDAIVGDSWDRIQSWSRWMPPVLGVIGATLMVDTATTLPVFRDPRQAIKLFRLALPTGVAHARRPWRLLAPAVSILRSEPEPRPARSSGRPRCVDLRPARGPGLRRAPLHRSLGRRAGQRPARGHPRRVALVGAEGPRDAARHRLRAAGGRARRRPASGPPARRPAPGRGDPRRCREGLLRARGARPAPRPRRGHDATRTRTPDATGGPPDGHQSRRRA